MILLKSEPEVWHLEIERDYIRYLHLETTGITKPDMNRRLAHMKDQPIQQS